ncbi:MAG: ribonuclease inhibitor [Synoicihabitans sp.]
MENSSKKWVWIACLVGVLAVGSIWWLLPLTGEGGSDNIRFAGRFHPVVLHLPIALFLLLPLLELRQLVRGNEQVDGLISFVLGLTVFTTLVAVVTGSLLAVGEGADEDLVVAHQRNGLLLGMAAIVLVGLRATTSRWIYRFGLLGSVALLAVTSHQGGSITHGRDYLTEYAPDEVRRFLGLEVEEPVVVMTADDLVVFDHLVQPIIEQNCVSCHNPDKLKGELNLETIEGHYAGGEMARAVVPGDIEASELYFRITLPQDDEEFMPPDEKTPLTADEVSVIAWWIEQGASADLTVGDLAEPSDVVADYVASIFARMLSPEELQKIENSRQELYAALGRIREEHGILIFPTEKESTEFTIETNAVRKVFNDDLLAVLEPYAESFVSADLSGTRLTDAGVEMLAKFERLRSLNLSQTPLSGATLSHLASLPELESLNLYGSEIDSSAVEQLAQLTQLKQLFLFQTALDNEASVSRLRSALPDCEIKVAAPVAPLPEVEEKQDDYESA